MAAPDYKAFVKWCLMEGPWQGCDVDGGSMQDAALKFGIIKQVAYDPEKHGPSNYDEEPGDPWFEMVEAE